MRYAERRRLQGRETERNILSTALELMRERGFDKVSVRDICRRAGITTGAFYHHFPSKEALLESGFAPLDDYIAQALKDQGSAPPDKKLWLILSAYARFMEHSGELIGRYYQRRIAEPGSKSLDSTRYTLRVMLECFRRAEAEGMLTAGRTPEWVADFCFRHFRGVVIDWALHGYTYSLFSKMKEDYEFFAALFVS